MKKYLLNLLGLLMVVTPFVNAQQQQQMPPDLEMALRKTQMAQMALKALYVDTVNADKLADDAIKGMLSALDPHSSYTTAEETKKLNEPLNGNFEGIGVQFNVLEDTLVVIQTITKGPSEKVGIIPGDRIIEVNGTTIAGVKMGRSDIMKNLRGPKGTLANVSVVRRGVPEVLKFSIVRDKIPLYSVDAAYMIRPHVGLIRISNFAVTTGKEVEESIKKLTKEGMKSLILDLEENGGGYLEAATEVASQFLERGDLIVYTDGRAVPGKKHFSEGEGKFRQGQLVVLVDDYTASAAEIVSGAVQDQDRGYIVGRRTFGKGLVQRPVPLPDGSLIRITISHYYTPSGRCIQKPYVKGQSKEYEDDIYQRYKNGELMHPDSIHFADSLKFKTLRKGRTVYGGGGIMPDYYIPLDTTRFTPYYRMLNLKNIILSTHLKYADLHRKEIAEKYADGGFKKYQKDFEVPQALLDSVVSAGHRANVKAKDEEEMQKTLSRLRITLKALIARDIWDISEYYAIVNEESPSVRKALELLGKE